MAGMIAIRRRDIEERVEAAVASPIAARAAQPAIAGPRPVAAADDRLAPMARAGWLIILLFFGVFGGWAMLAPLGGAVVSSGYFKVDGNRRAVQHLDGGIVAQVHVREGDHVDTGALLVELDQNEAGAELGVLVQQHLALRLTQARLRAELTGADQLQFPPDLAAYRTDAEAEALWQAQLRQFEARRNSLSGQRAVVAEKIAQLQSEMQGSEQQLQGRRAQLKSVEAERDSLLPLVDRGVVTKQRLNQLERTVAQFQGETGELANAVARATQGIAEQRQVALQLGNEQLAEASRELRDTQAVLIELLPRLANARAKLQRTEVKALAAGRVVGLTVFSPGAVIGRGEKLMEIVPDRDSLVIEAQIPVEQIADVKPGMAATIHLTALKDHGTPVVGGTVSHVSADRLAEERTGRPYFAVIVAVDPAELAANPDVKLHPGMPVTVMLPTRSRTAFRYLVDPLIQAVSGAFREK